MAPYIVEPLHDLLRRGVLWASVDECEQAFAKSKSVISEESPLVLFDPNKSIILRYDSSCFV